GTTPLPRQRARPAPRRRPGRRSRVVARRAPLTAPRRIAAGRNGYPSPERLDEGSDDARSAQPTEHDQAIVEEGAGHVRQDPRARRGGVRRRPPRAPDRVRRAEALLREEGRPLGREVEEGPVRQPRGEVAGSWRDRRSDRT